MGKIRIKTLGIEEIEKEQKEEARKRAEIKKQTSEKVRPLGGKGGERMKQIDIDEKDLSRQIEAEKLAGSDQKQQVIKEEEAAKEKSKKIQKKVRGKRYFDLKQKIKNAKKISIKDALSLLKTSGKTKFNQTVEIHLNLFEEGVKGEVTYPFSAGKSVRVVAVNDTILEQIKSNKIDFDVLVATPADMPKLVPFAKILGPKGLMPNPKQGTITDKPNDVIKKISQGAVRFKSEAKFPIIHQTVGKLSQPETELEKNIEALIKAVGKSKIKSAFISATMSPSVKIII